jgi:hypothetical protein
MSSISGHFSPKNSQNVGKMIMYINNIEIIWRLIGGGNNTPIYKRLG